VIAVEHLVRMFGALAAVDDISFTVSQGEIFGFLGPNGAGKTTTINVLCTLLRPTAGRVHVAGFDALRQRDAVRRAIGLVFQEPALDLKLTAEENVYLHARLYGVDAADYRRRLEEVLRLVELWDRRRDRVETYSGGMKRRLEIARGLMTRPAVLFLDEPTLGLDPQSRLRVWDYIRQVNREGTTIFLTTHYMDEADSLSDRISIIDHGKIIVSGTSEELKNALGEDMIYLETGDDAKTTGILKGLPEVKDMKPSLRGLSVTLTNEGTKTLPVILDRLKEGGIQIRSANLKKPTLDDVFVHFTGREIRG